MFAAFITCTLSEQLATQASGHRRKNQIAPQCGSFAIIPRKLCSAEVMSRAEIMKSINSLRGKHQVVREIAQTALGSNDR